MAVVILRHDRAARGVLPAVCMKCGGPAAGQVPVTFYPLPAWTVLPFLAGCWPVGMVFLFVALCRGAPVRAPLCEAHRSLWRSHRLQVAGCGLALFFLALVARDLLADAQGPWETAPGLFAYAGVAVLCLLAAAPIVLLRRSAIRLARVGVKAVALKGVAGEFAEAVRRGDRTGAAAGRS